MGKASEEALSDLHGTVARVLTKHLEDEIEIVTETGETKTISNCTPAMMAQAVKFLKDNDITSNVEQDENLQDLQKQLQDKRRKRTQRAAGIKLVKE